MAWQTSDCVQRGHKKADHLRPRGWQGGGSPLIPPPFRVEVHAPQTPLVGADSPPRASDEVGQVVASRTHLAARQAVEQAVGEGAGDSDRLGRIRPLRASLIGPHREGHVGADHAGGEFEDLDALAGGRLVEASGQPHERGLGRVVRTRPGGVLHGRARGEIEDPPSPVGDHRRDDPPLDEEGRAKIDLQGTPPVLGVGLPRGRLLPQDSRAVDDHVDRAVGERDVEHRLDVAGFGQLGPHGAHPGARLLAGGGDGAERGDLPGHEHEAPAGAGQPLGQMPADPPRGAGEEDALARLHARSSAPKALRAALSTRLRTRAVSSAVRVASPRRRSAKARDFLPSATCSPV